MTRGSVAPGTSVPGDECDGEDQYGHDGNDGKDFHPPGDWWPRLALRIWVGHAVPFCASGLEESESTRQSVSVKSSCIYEDVAYTPSMPKLWSETVEAHRHQVRDAILDATVALAEKHGLLSVTMSQVAEETGIGRATLYKYFPDVEAILLAWHEREITAHVGILAGTRDRAGSAGERLAAVLEGYALIAYEFRGHRDPDLAALLHRDEHVGRAEKLLHAMVRDLLIEAAEIGDVRDDVAADELASYCLHALTASNRLRSKAAVRRLVAVTLDGLRPPH